MQLTLHRESSKMNKVIRWSKQLFRHTSELRSQPTQICCARRDTNATAIFLATAWRRL
jgi:hypothetical protein